MFQPALYFNNVTVLTAEGIIGHSLRVRGASIVAIDDPPHKNDRVVEGQGGIFIPGLINAHDHLELNTFKRLKYREQYSHSRQWIEDIEARFDSDPDLVEPRQQPLADRLLASALKNLLSGVTTICHHNPLHRFLRFGYPIDVVKEYGFCHSLFRGDNPTHSYQKTKPDQPWMIHLAEGVDAEAQSEFEQLFDLGLVQPNTVLVHGVGLTSDQRQTLLERGGALIWCPGSNNFLFGQTAEVCELAQAGRLALGSDSRLSGEFDLLEELRLAYASNQLSPQQLFQIVTTGPARILRLRRGGLGQIRPGGQADLVLLPPPSTPDYFLDFLSLKRSQVALVLQAGRPLVGSLPMRPLFEMTRTRPEMVWVDDMAKLIPQKLATRLKRSPVQEPGLAFSAPS
jgi:cytosine/adenosine deaminase-related metal-dependent hydrolase